MSASLHPTPHLLGEHHDVVVIGGRVAGAATAMLLARQGLRVLVLERGRYGDDTLSTHALLRVGVLQLHRWGLLRRIAEAGTPPLHRTTFSYPDEEIANSYGATFFPSTIFIDASGEVAYTHTGPYSTAEDLAADIDRYALGS